MISVLYVDDEPGLLEIGKLFLEATADFAVDTITSASSALEILPQKQYDAIVSDYQMPGMNGIAFLKAVRATGSNIPFILFTGRGREEVVIDAINNGVDFYLQKGGDPTAQFAELAHKIRQTVRRRSAEENLQKSEELHRTIINDLSEMIVRFDPDGTITFSNAAYTSFILSWRGVDGCVGKNFREILGPEKYETELGRAIALLTPDQPYHSQEITETWDDRTTHWYQWGIRAFFSPDGAVSEFQGVGHDITDLKENENDLRAANEQLTASEEELRNQFEELADNQAALKKSEEKFRDIVETSLDLIWEMDSDGTFTYMSPSCTDTLGYSPAELVGRTVFGIVPEKDRSAFRELFSKGIRTMKQKNEFDLPFQCKDGRVRVMETRSIPLLDNTGRFTGFRGTARDITEQRKALKALAENEEKFRSIFDNSPYPIAINSFPDNRFLEVNRAFLEISEYTREEILGKDPVGMGFLPLSEALRLISHRLLKGTMENVPLAVIAKGGKRVHVLFSTLPITIGGRSATITVTAEVTKLKRVEEELIQKNEDLQAAYEELTATEEDLRSNYDRLARQEQVIRESEEKFRALVENSLDGIFITDMAGLFLFANRAAGEIIDCPDPSRIIGKNVRDYVAPASMEAVMNDIAQVAQGHDAYLVTYPLVTEKNRTIWVECVGKKIPFEGSTAMLVSMRDVTRRKLAEEQMRESEIKFSTVFQRSPVALTLVSATEGKFVDANDAFFTNTGYSRDEVIGRRTEDVGIFTDTNEYDRFASALKGRRIIHGMEMKCRIKSGDIRACSFSSGIILVGGKPHILSTVEDITERKKTEDALGESEEKFRTLVENSLDGILILDPQGTILFANHAAGKIIEDENFHDLIGVRNVMEFIAPESHADAIRDFSTVATGVDGYLARYKLTTVHQKERWVESIGKSVIFDGTAAILISLRDITERVITQSALQTIVGSMVGATGLNSLRKIAENISSWLGADCVMVGEIQPDNQTVRVLSMQLDGKAVEDFIYTLKGTPCENVAEMGFCHYPDDAIRLFPMSKDLAELNIRGYIGTPLKNSDGKIIGILCALFRNPFQSSPTVQEIMAIIAVQAGAEIERSQMERALRESEEKFRSFVENANEIIFSLTPDGIFTYVSPNWTEWLGHDTREVIGKDAVDFIHPDDFPKNREFFLQTLAKEKTMSGIEFRIRHKNGSWWWHSHSFSLISNTEGRVVAIQGICHDITDRKRAEAELQKSQYFLSEAMGMAQMADWEFDVPTGIFTFNDRFYALYGTTAGREGGYQMPYEVYAREFVHPEDQYMVGEEMAKALSKPESGYFTLREQRIIRRDGEVRDIVVHIRVTKVAEGRIIKTHGANQDITDRKKMEEAIRQANKKLSLLSSITRHDINNQLMALDGFVSLLQLDIPDTSNKKYFSRITEASKNIAEMIRFTKEYEKIGTGAPVWQDLTTVITAAGKGIIPGQFTLKNDLPATTEVFADPMLEKIFFNLLDNAARHGERVTQIHVSARPAGENLVIAWEDNGIGIAADEKERIFERGFGKNTGLGMFLVREILSLTGISIAETGEPGRGARFEMTVPRGAYRIRS